MNTYRVLVADENKKWEIGDIVLLDHTTAVRLGDSVELYKGEIPHKHVQITVDPARLKAKTKKKE